MNPRDHELEFVRRHLQQAVPPWPSRELHNDLWPRMLRRMEHAPPQFGWWDALLAAMIVLALALFPRLIPVMFYHL